MKKIIDLVVDLGKFIFEQIVLKIIDFLFFPFG